MEWDSNPRLLRDWCLKPAPWTARPSNLKFRADVYGIPNTYNDFSKIAKGFFPDRELNPGLVGESHLS